VSQEPEGGDSLLGLLAGIGVGLLVGAAVALLAAPQSGEATREQLREGAEDLLGNIKESVDDLRVKLDEVRSAIRRRAPGGSEEEEGTEGGQLPAAG
jgi:gas vesicle protein